MSLYPPDYNKIQNKCGFLELVRAKAHAFGNTASVLLNFGGKRLSLYFFADCAENNFGSLNKTICRGYVSFSGFFQSSVWFICMLCNDSIFAGVPRL